MHSQKKRLKNSNCLWIIREAMESLDKDRDFLKQGNVLLDQIDAYITLKFEEIIL